MYIRNILIAGFAAASTVEAYGNSTIREEQKIWEVGHLGAPKGKRFLGGAFDLVGGILGGFGFGGGGDDEDAPQCPDIWTQISKTLTQQFLGDGQCTDAARAAIRASFHDCFNGACDGSLILANECSNIENRGMERLCSNLANVATQTKVGVADLIQFAAAHAVKTCPGGPTVPVKVGRQDSKTPGALGVLPGPNVRGDVLVRTFGKQSTLASLHMHPFTNNVTLQHPKASAPSISPPLSAHIRQPSSSTATPPKLALPLTLPLVLGTTSSTLRPGVAVPLLPCSRTRTLQTTRLLRFPSLPLLSARARGMRRLCPPWSSWVCLACRAMASSTVLLHCPAVAGRGMSRTATFSRG